ncbi:chitobiase/beta-hexosaminidase C-terminal domain-containing protein [Marinimicrobium sp. C6131]|nr:chitobiase/beta-hexosaminidase C-terminal domain-containing protein [Marinimicrobium sp. C6131]
MVSTSTTGATIRYTTNGASVTSSSPVYSGPINITSSRTVKAKAFRTGWKSSGTRSRSFTILPPPVAPTINPQGGIYYDPVKITLSTPESGIAIRYTTNNSQVTSSSPLYTGPITVSSTVRLRARGYTSGGAPGTESSVYFQFKSHGSVTTDYGYDALGRLIERSDSNGHHEEYQYDAAGNRESVERDN